MSDQAISKDRLDLIASVRLSELFHEDLYPDTLADVPAITADEWWSGTNAEPILVPISESGVQAKAVSTLHRSST